MTGDDEPPMTPRRRRARSAETAAVGLSDETIELDTGDEPVTPAETEPVQPAETAAPNDPPSRDIGNWRYTPWHGRDMWTHKKRALTEFDEKAVRKLRHQ